MRTKGIKEKKPRETLKRQRLIKQLLKGLDNLDINSLQRLSQTAGYTLNSRQVYSKSTKTYIELKMKELGYSTEESRDFFILLRQLAMGDKDYKEARVNTENLVRMSGGFKDSSTNINIYSLKDMYDRTNKRIDRITETVEPKEVREDDGA